MSHVDFLSRIHKADSTEDENKGEESVGHYHVDRANDEGESPEVSQQAERANDDKTGYFPPENAKTKANYLSLKNCKS
jgi:hypothetical protein